MMEKAFSRALACTALAFSAIVPSMALAAANASGRGVSGLEVVRILQDEGYRAKLDKDGEGDPMVRTGMGGLDAVVYFYDCEDGRCSSLKLAVGIDLKDGTSLAVLNRFARAYRYVRTYLDDENDPFIEFDFEVLHTDHASHIASQVALYEQLLDAFARAVGLRGSSKDASDAPAATTTTTTLATIGAFGPAARLP